MHVRIVNKKRCLTYSVSFNLYLSTESIGLLSTTPVVIRGVRYSSCKEAAEMLGVSASTVSYHLNRGSLDHVGVITRKKAVKIGEVTYESHTAAAKALGIARKKISRAVKNNTLEQLL